MAKTQQSNAGDESSDPSGKCPVCYADAAERCEHLVSTWEFVDDGGEWKGSESPFRVRDVSEEFGNLLSAKFTESQLELIVLMLRLPSDLLKPLSRIDATGDWQSYIEKVTLRGATYVCGTPGESGGGGTSSSWTNHWAKNPVAWSRSVTKELKDSIRLIKTLIKMAKKLPTITEEEE